MLRGVISAILQHQEDSSSGTEVGTFGACVDQAVPGQKHGHEILGLMSEFEKLINQRKGWEGNHCHSSIVL